jgi:hypothetical protein
LIADGAAGLGGVALFAAAGLGMAELSPTLRRLSLVPRLGYAYLLGLAGVAGALYALSHWAAVPLRAPAVWSAAAVPALLGLAAALRRRRAGRRRQPRPPARPAFPSRGSGGSVLREPWVLLCVGVTALIVCGLVADAATDPVKDWDGRMTWSMQARYVRAEGTVDAEVLRHKRWFVTHPQYPLLMPVAQVAVLEAFAQSDDSHAFRMLYAGAFAAWLLVVYDGARRLAGRRPAALAVLLAAAVPFFEYGEGGASSAYSDLPLAGFYGAALVLLVVRPPRPADGWVAGLFLAAAVLTKNEGLPLAALVLALAAGRTIARKRMRGEGRGGAARRRLAALTALTALTASVLAAVVALAALTLLASWRAGIPNRQDEKYVASFRPRELWPAVVTRAPSIVPILLARMFDWRRWTAFWWAIPAVLAAGWRAVARRRRLPLLLAAAAPPAIGWVAYCVRPDGAAIAGATWERFLLQASVPLLLLVASALGDVLRRVRSTLRPA